MSVKEVVTEKKVNLDSSVFGDRTVQNMLDTDLYVFNMMAATLHQCSSFLESGEFSLICRSDVDLRPYTAQFKFELEKLEKLSLTLDQKLYMKKEMPWLKENFLEYLRLFRFNLKFLHFSDNGKQLEVRFSGPVINGIPFEVPCLATISEVYNRNVNGHIQHEDLRKSVMTKIEYLQSCIDADPDGMKDFKFADFGTRRRFSFESQRLVVDLMSRLLPNHFVGTSNVHLAKEYKVKPIGTMAHLWQMMFQQSHSRVENSVEASLDAWVKEFRGELGYALTDTLTTDHFFSKFDSYYAKLFDGLRQDSGCPFEFGEKAIAHYEKLGIDPKTKLIIFSDGLDFKVAIDIYYRFKDRIKVSFGIGTFLTNNIPGVDSISIVMKLTRVNGEPVAKISDTPEKAICVEKYFIDYLMSSLKISQLKK